MERERPSETARQERRTVVLSPEQARSRRARSIAIALALGALVILFYAVTLVKGPAVLNRPL
ncbi:MAG TPA: CoxF protein [Xanthobacteraceae bacterium]